MSREKESKIQIQWCIYNGIVRDSKKEIARREQEEESKKKRARRREQEEES